MLNVETIRKVRQAYFRDGKKIRAITRELNLSRNTVRDIIRSGKTDQQYERSTQPYPKLGDFIERLVELLREDSSKPAAHRRSAQLLFSVLSSVVGMIIKLIWTPPVEQAIIDAGVEIWLQSYIRPVVQAKKPAGPDGIRRESPHFLGVLERLKLIQVFFPAVRPIPPSIRLSTFATCWRSIPPFTLRLVCYAVLAA